MNRRQIIIYSIFAVVSVYGIYFHFLSGEPTKQAEIKTPTANTAVGSAPDSFEIPVPANDIVKVPDSSSAIQRYPTRNPFKNRNANYIKKPAAGIPINSARPNITAISGNGAEALVIADNKVIKIGEKIGNWKLVRVESEKALFDGPGGSIWVYLGG
jgi:hypothetical protein